ncbi:MAG: NADP-dependent 3-hydroxy acid dehydrogenase YdfG [Parcubacteria group bacterium ADurb.Bin316]|nr:MAG: NADP-dependent 3-hydroxy acid dehydrogenase YdfG [Parcubacteria group bacterium ADurb.Bin316]
MKTIIVTGANAGIGKACSMQLAQLGHRVIMACRNQQRGEAARQEIISQTGNLEVILKIVDLSSLASLTKFVAEVAKEYDQIDVLINNGADFDISRRKKIVTEDGLESQFATNVVAPFFLSLSLLPMLEKSSAGKIVNISSQGLVMYPFIKLRIDDLNCQKKYDPATQYYQNKLALLMLSLYMKENFIGKTKIIAIRVTNVKVDVLIDAIEDANTTIEGYLTIIADAREAFAAAIENGNAAAADEAAALADGTFVTLVSYMEDNPDSYNTVSLYSGFISEFTASTNAVTFMIITYNGTVTDYNTHIKTFPNIIFVGGRAIYNSYELTNYNVELPTFK